MKLFYLISLMLIPNLLFANTAEQTEIEAKATAKDAQQLLSDVRLGLETMKADFKQYEVNQDNQHGEESVGLVWLKAPDQFRWHYKQPIEQLIIADGEKVWVYDEDLEQVTVNWSCLASSSVKSIALITISRGGRSISIPARAYSYSFLPSFFNAEYIGGICC